MSELWDSPLYPIEERLEMAKGGIAFRDKVIANLRERLELATQELKNIANADTIAWDDSTEFEAWAKSRARWALGKIGEGK